MSGMSGMSPSISIRIHGPIAGPDIHLKPRAKYYSLSFSPARLYRLIFALVNTLPLRSLVLHFRFLLILILGSVPPLVWAQQPIPGAPLRLDNATAADSSQPQSRDGWSTPYPNIHFTKGNRLTLHHPDTSIHLIHRHRFLQPALRNLGNHGSATRSLIFQPDMDAGPRLGYRLFDP